MTRITTTPLAVSEDYRDALVAARRAKNWLFLLLLLFLLAQITIFFLVKYDVIRLTADGQATVQADVSLRVQPDDIDVDVTTQPATAPSDADTAAATTDVEPSTRALTASENVGKKELTHDVLAWLTNSIVYLGTIFSILMAVVILLIVLIMLVGRFPGGGMRPSTSSFVWMALLALLLFPWQLCYGPETSAEARLASGVSAYADSPNDDFRVPGALYTWGELRQDAKFANSPMTYAVQKWARFAGFPFIALIILFAVQAKSGRAVKIALGEADVHVDVATTDM